MKKLFLILICAVLMSAAAAYAQDIVIVRPTAVPETVPIISRPTTGTETAAAGTSASGTKTVRLWDRSVYENQPKSVVLPNAKEMFQTGLEVPLPDLDRPITQPWDDLRQGYACEAILNRPYYFEKMSFGQEFTLDMTFRNVGTETWDFNVDVMKYTGDPLEKQEGQIVYDIWKDVGSKDPNTHIVKPGQSIRVTIPMRAPTEKYHDDNKYYAAYTLVKDWNRYGWDALHDGHWDRMDGHALFCPVYFYIYVPD